MSNKDTSGPAFPTERVGMESGEFLTYQEEGMTLRDYFAAKAMQSELLDREWLDVHSIAEYAYDVADAMLKARNGNS